LSYINFISPSDPKNQSSFDPHVEVSAKNAAPDVSAVYDVAPLAIIADEFAFPAPTARAAHPLTASSELAVFDDHVFEVPSHDCGAASK
jgi:hypothetical protein